MECPLLSRNSADTIRNRTMRPVIRGIYAGSPDNEYGDYRGELLSHVGSYCSYCEVPLTLSVDVEHKVAKGAIATWDNLWDNFLLACKSCNSAKGGKPNQGKGSTRITTTYAKDYVWPDGWSWPGNNDAKVGADPDPTITPTCSNFFTYQKKIDTTLDPGSTTARVWVYQNSTYSLNTTLYPRIQETIDLVKLNAFNVADPKISNQRVIRRTEAWDAATQAATIINAIPAGTTANAIYAIHDQVSDLARALGFWSVWMTVFKANSVPTAVIAEILIQNPRRNNNWNGTNIVFPGTDIARLTDW